MCCPKSVYYCCVTLIHSIIATDIMFIAGEKHQERRVGHVEKETLNRKPVYMFYEELDLIYNGTTV